MLPSMCERSPEFFSAALMEDRLVNSSSSFRNQCNYDVFLSFTGQDTRHAFTGTLYNALCEKGICTFIDDEGLKTGEQISPALLRAIEQSRISIIVFSENYAFSSWCLDELVQILECRTKGQLVRPVFYKVDPSEVRRQKGSFGRAMAEHERRFKGDPAKVHKWKLALTEAADLSGFHYTDGYEFKFIERIIEAVSSILNRVPLHVAEHPVGLESRISDLCSRLGMGSNDVRMIGIHGLGGVGKTTLAQALYNKIADQFEGASFVADVGESSSKRELLKLQEEFLAEITEEKNINLHHVNRGINIIKDRLCYKKVLLILDDVQKSEHLEKLAGSVNWFGPGSRIIVTTRNVHLLIARGVKILYEVQKLNYDESLELFCCHAFNRKIPLGDYTYIAKRAVRYANGLPLALKIIGSNLCGKNTDESMCALNNYERIPPGDIQRILQISYDNLEENEKEIFLDLACFFKGEKLEYVEKILKASGFDPVSGIGVLEDKSLIKVEHNRVKMHDLIQDMGKAIIRQSSRLHPGKRSRLWHDEDIIEVLTNNTGTKKIEGIMLDLDEEQEVRCSGDTFRKMEKLRILVVRNGVFSTGPTYLPNSLKVLEWIKYPSSSLPEEFDPMKLVVMSLPNSRLTSLKPFKELKSLTSVDFSGCELLEKIPDMSAAPNLTKLKLDFCWNLVEIHYSIGYLGKLVSLSARSCIRLKSFPHEIRMMSLEHLDLGGFSSLQSFPVWEELENVSVDRQGAAIEEFPSSLGNLSKLKHIGLDYCMRLWNIPSSIAMLTNLTSISMVSCPQVVPSLVSNLDFGELRYPLVSMLNLQQCSLTDEALPVIVRCFPNVVYLNLSSNDFVMISACTNELQYLQRFHVDDCILLKEIKGCPPKLALLSAANCDRLTSKSTNMLGLAHQGSPERNFEAILPASMIPECCDHYFGQGQMSYWVRKSFLDVSLCLVSEMEDEGKLKEDCYATFRISVSINSNPILKFSVTRECYKTSNHVRLIHLHSYMSECSSMELGNFKNVDTLLQLEWNRVEILWKVDFFQPTEEFDLGITGPGRVRIWGNQSNTEDILFTERPESQGSATSSSTAGNETVNSDGGEDIQIVNPELLRAAYPSSSFRQQWTYDVFLSFNEDTRHNFTGHLYHALSRKGIHSFINDQKLNRREDISAPLFKVIEQSRILIIIFSESYEFSSWCLDELAKIIECKETMGRLVWPVFYHVDPSEVRESLGRAMAEHEDKFRSDPTKVQKWKMALYEATNLCGWHFTNGPEHVYDFVQGIVEQVTQYIGPVLLYVARYPVGLKSRVSYLTSQLLNVQMIGIYGLGGVGKTTLACAVHNSIVGQFEEACFLFDVGERSGKHGLVELQERILYETTGERNMKLCNDVQKNIPIIKERLHSKKILLILDDVQNLVQLKSLGGSPDWFDPGSRIIVTTRDKQLLIAHGVDMVYEVEALNFDESLELYSWNAFKRHKPERGYEDIAKRVVRYTNGLPLALEVIGSNFFGKQLDEQRHALDIYENIPDKNIQGVLKVSYDYLADCEKEIFLDLACFFIGEILGYVVKILDACGFRAEDGIECLISKSLVRVENDVIKMQNLIQDMGRAIVRENSPSNPSQRSRLWFHQDILKVLIDNTGTENIEGIMLDLNGEQQVQWKGDAFKRMPNLRILIVRNALFSTGPTYFPSSLRVLEWIKYPSPCLPKNCHLPKLVVMHLPKSLLTSFKPFKGFECLTCMDLSESKSLTNIPDMSEIPNLMELKLDFCQNLVEIHDSVGFLLKLVTLSARQCSYLASFPQEMRLTSLQKLDLGACSSLQSFPNVLEKVENIREVSLERTAIQELPYSMGNLFGLRLLKLDHCRSLRNIPRSIGMLTNLTEISMACCPQAFQSFICKLAFGKFRYFSVYKLNLQSCDVSDKDLPVIASCFPNAKYLDLSKNKFVKVSARINKLYCLEKLYLANCKLLEEIEGIPPNLVVLSATNCNRLTLQSANMIALAHQKSSNKRFEVKLPGAGIPECFNYYIGEGKMSFWVCQNFPNVALCLAFEFEDEEKLEGSFYLECSIWVQVNNLPFSQPKAYREFRTSHHLQLVHLHSYVDDFKNLDRFEWNHVEILWDVKYHQFPLNMAKPGRVHIYGEETSMKDILLRKPPESQCTDTLLSTTEKGTDKTEDSGGGCSLPKTLHDDLTHSQQCMKAINQQNNETYRGGGNTRDQGDGEMMGSNQRSQWRFSLCALISSLVSLCSPSSP